MEKWFKIHKFNKKIVKNYGIGAAEWFSAVSSGILWKKIRKNGKKCEKIMESELAGGPDRCSHCTFFSILSLQSPFVLEFELPLVFARLDLFFVERTPVFAYSQ